MIYLRKIINKYIKIIRYFSFSVFVTFIDFFIVWVLMYFGLSLVLSNTIGVIIGFIIHYILSSKSVFDTNYGILGFVVYLGTFLLGLIFADLLIYFSYNSLIAITGKDSALLISKGISIAGPFFIMYFLRRLIYMAMKKYYRNGNEVKGREV